MNPNHKNLRVVPQLIYGRGSVRQLGDVLAARRTDSATPTVFLIDDVFEEAPFVHDLPVHANDLIIFVNCDVEPKTRYVDELTQRIKDFSNRMPDALVGIGGGSALDLTKAVSLMLTNPGSAADYQGWDLIQFPGIYNIGIPTLAVTAVGKEMARDARYLGLATRVCAELGAHFIKTYFCAEGFDKVVAACPVPIVIAGGKKIPEPDALNLAYKAIDQGAAGVDMGRNIFAAESPVAMIQAVRAVVHEGLKPDKALDMYQTLKSELGQ